MFPTDSRNTAENVSTVDWHAITSVTGCDASRDKNIISVAFFSCDGDALVEEAMELLSSKTFMVTLREDIAI